MAVAHVTTQGASINGTATATITFSAYVPQENDLIVFVPSSQSSIVAESDANLNPAGWFNPLGDGVDVDNGSAMGAMIVYHQVTAAEALSGEDTYSVTCFTGAETGYVVGDIWRGHDTSAPIRKVGTAANPLDTTEFPTAPVAGVGPPNLVTGDQVMAHLARDNAIGVFTPGSAGPGWTERLIAATNQARWAGSRDALTVANTDVASVNVENSVADENIGITYIIAAAADSGDIEETPEDAIGITDAATTQVDRILETDDDIGITDTATVQADRVNEYDDPIGILDDTLVILDAIIDESADSIGIADTVLVVVSSSTSLDLTDTIGILDAATITLARVIEADDAIGITDTVVATTADLTDAQDDIGITDDVELARSIVLVLNDAVGLTDEFTLAGAETTSVINTIGIADAITLAVSRIIVITDSIGIEDSIAEEDFDDVVRINRRYVTAIRINGRNVTAVRINGRDVAI